MGHLGELRKRLTYSAIVVVVFVIAAFIEKEYVFAVLMRPLAEHRRRPSSTTFGVTEAFMQVLKVSIYAGLIYRPALHPVPVLGLHHARPLREREAQRHPLRALHHRPLPGRSAFAYFVVLPVGLRFLIGYGGEHFNQLLQAERYISFISMFLLAFGVVFELPLVMMLSPGPASSTTSRCASGASTPSWSRRSSPWCSLPARTR